MNALVTGAAGFIGSHLVEALVAEGNTRVRALDCLTPYYSREVKRRTLTELDGLAGVEVLVHDLSVGVPPEWLQGVDVVYHLAGQPGVRLSWSEHFEAYLRHNVLATQRLLESMTAVKPAPHLVVASSSSVYGNVKRRVSTELDLPMPFSPYGVTKLAAEHLCTAYAENHGLTASYLRFFTVYGPRQRPDMAFHRLIECALHDRRFDLYGDGSQAREFTYVTDVVRACLVAGAHSEVNGPLNVAGQQSVSIWDAIQLVALAVGTEVSIRRHGTQNGDVAMTAGDTSQIRSALDWRPLIDLQTGLQAQVAWHRARP